MEPAWGIMTLKATGALSLCQGKQYRLWKVNFLSLSFPWSGPPPEPCDAYLFSADLWNEVIQEVESL